VVSKHDYLNLLSIYAKSQHRKRDDGKIVPWIDEDLNPLTGDWMARTIMHAGNGPIRERGKDYNHSTFCDLIINGLIGLRPRADNTVEVNPLIPDGTWDYFCLDGVKYHGVTLAVFYDRNGERYARGRGLRLLANGKEMASSPTLTRLGGSLAVLAPAAATAESEPPATRPAANVSTAGGWTKYNANPVLGGKYGTCFDISVLRDNDVYRMWVSWRPKKSIALVESADGQKFNEAPKVVLGPAATGWEDDINRPVVIKRDDGYHMWYTGQAKGRSAIGYATSSDGLVWKRMSDQPVLKPELPWEKVAVMCPDVMWDDAARLFRMWYSGGEQYEPNAIGYASSTDGLHWTKSSGNPVFAGDGAIPWERQRATACHVVLKDGWYYLFYIGFRDIDHAAIGIARSRDGVGGWQRLPANPIIFPAVGQWDSDACYKPYAIFDGTRWLLWYNGRSGSLEQIGVASHDGADLGFDSQ
jgi:predicted GH43/DUF377 family glycosyl hydrolase